MDCSEMTGAVLEFRDVTIRYDEAAPPVLAALSVAIAAGERVAVLGLNGAGKTTMLLAAAGLVPFEGAITVCGLPVVRKNVRAVRDRLGLVFSVPEDQLLFPSVLEDVAFGLRRRGVAPIDARGRARRALEALDVGGLADGDVHHLSHGQRQRVALAGALVTEPRILLLDEPSSGLDPPARRKLCQHLLGLDTTIVIATHDLPFASALCSRFLLLEAGRVVVDGISLAPVRRRWRTNRIQIAG
jgi:cobalt/nickel transport system ATP-binding protein